MARLDTPLNYIRRSFRPILAALVFSGAGLVAIGKSASIRDIDFKNFLFPWDDDLAAGPFDLDTPWHWIESLPESRIRVTGGRYHFYSPDQDEYERSHAPLISVDSVTYGDLDGDGKDEAAVHLNYSTGGTANWDYLYVYKLVGGDVRLLGILQSGSRGYGGLGRTVIQKGLLVLDFADPERRVGDCCSEGYIRVRYRWRNGAFVEEGPRERGDVNLNVR